MMGQGGVCCATCPNSAKMATWVAKWPELIFSITCAGRDT